MRIRCLILFAALAGVAPASVAQTPILNWSHDPLKTKLSFLSWDTEGRGAASRNLLRPEGLRLAAKINGGPIWIDTHDLFRTLHPVPGGVSYRISMGTGITLVWTITQEGAGLTQDFSVVETESGRVDALQLQFMFDPHVTPTAIVPAAWASDNSLRPPLLISAPDFGQMYLSAEQGVVERGVLAGLRSDTAPWSYLGLNLARPPGQGNPPYRINFKPLSLPRPALVSSQRAWELARRGWWNAFNPSFHWSNPMRDVPSGILANNSISVPCALALQFPADSAYWTPDLAPGVSAMGQVGRTIDWWLDPLRTAYTDVEESPGVFRQHGKVPGCLEPQPPWERRYLLDGNPGVLIAAWDYVETTPDPVPWLEQRYDKLQAISAFLEHRRDTDGLVKCDNSGLPGHLYTSADRACGWFDVVASGHKDAYVNAFVYRAWRGMAKLAERLGQSADQAHYTSLANQLKASYRTRFYDPTVGWLAWWVDTAGTKHTYSSIVVNGLAIEYGLIDPVEGRLILERLRTKMATPRAGFPAGFTRFDLGVPNVLDPIRKEDYVPGTFGSPQLADGTDTFGKYENGGITAGQVLHFLAAHYVVGDPGPAEAILWPMLHRLRAGGFQNGSPWLFGQAIDWTNWKGGPSGYEGMLADVYRFPQAVLLREPLARQRFYAHLYPGGSVPAGAPTPPDPPLPPPSTCASVKPYEGHGVTGAWEDETGRVWVTSGDKYWQLGGDPGDPGGGLAFQGAGYIDDLPDWSTAPRVGGVLPWDCEGVGGVSRNVGGGGLHIMTSNRWWELRANGSWGVGDFLKTMWQNSGVQPVERLPWDPPGITASWVAIDGSVRMYVSKDRYWQRTFITGTGWSWSQGYLNALWSGAPPQSNGLFPWQGDGVTAVFRANGRLWIINKDRYWLLDEATGAWQVGGLLSSIWAGAPAACGSPPQPVILPGDPVCTVVE